jgi:hypothetical protein
MLVHARARLTPKRKALVVDRVLEHGWSVTPAASAADATERAVYRWIARYRAEGQTGLRHRSSAPRSIPHRTPSERVDARIAVDLVLGASSCPCETQGSVDQEPFVPGGNSRTVCRRSTSMPTTASTASSTITSTCPRLLIPGMKASQSKNSTATTE